MKLGVKVIHCSERDTQITDQPKQVDEFVNTWSVEGFREEGTTTAEMGWGTHEKELPRAGLRARRRARATRSAWRAWASTPGSAPGCPNYCIHGMVVRHGEAFTISDQLTVWENGKAVYRPTVHYAYCPCDAAIVSLNELRGYDYQLQPKLRIMNDEITSGADILGALLMGHAYNSWWIGSDLCIEESRRLVPHQNATTMQVAISVVAAAAVDDREPGPRRVRARRPAARVRAEDRQAVPGQVHLHAVRLDAAEALHQRLQGLQPARPWTWRTLAVQELPDHGWGLDNIAKPCLALATNASGG